MRRVTLLAALGAAASAGFAVLTLLEREHRLAKQDTEGLRKIAPADPRHRRAAELLHPLGKWWSYVPASVVAGGAVYARARSSRRERSAAAAAIVLAAGVSALLNPLFDKVLPQPPLPPGRRSNPKPTFPSGHAFGLGAVALTIAYVLRAEELVGSKTAVAIALLPPLTGGVAKIVEEKHWPSEVAGGFLVGLAIASASALLFELERKAPIPDRRSGPLHASEDALCPPVTKTSMDSSPKNAVPRCSSSTSSTTWSSPAPRRSPNGLCRWPTASPS